MTRAELYERTKCYVRWRGAVSAHRLVTHDRGSTDITALTHLPAWITEIESRGEAIAADAETAITAKAAATQLDADTLRIIAADIGEDRLDDLLALPVDAALPRDGGAVLATALSAGPDRANSRALIKALLQLAPVEGDA